MIRWFTLLAVLATAGTAPAQWCLDADEIDVEIDGDQVVIHHDAAYYNCCPDPFTYEVTFADGVLTVIETEVLSNPCYCLCCYDLWAVVDNVPSGDWTLVYHWYDYEAYDWVSMTVPFEVPDAGQNAPAGLVMSDRSECLTRSSVDDPDPALFEWGRVKTLYR